MIRNNLAIFSILFLNTACGLMASNRYNPSSEVSTPIAQSLPIKGPSPAQIHTEEYHAAWTASVIWPDGERKDYVVEQGQIFTFPLSKKSTWTCGISKKLESSPKIDMRSIECFSSRSERLTTATGCYPGKNDDTIVHISNRDGSEYFRLIAHCE